MMTRHYEVAGHLFAVSGKAELFELMGNYEPFECEDDEPLFSLSVDGGVAPEYTEVYRVEAMRIICGRTALGENVYDIMREETRGCLICSEDYREGRLITIGDIPIKMLDRVLMIMFSLATAGKDTLLFHAVVVSCEDKGYLFLGRSGTGKSTHAQLWLEHIKGTELVNDDYPVVRNGVVYGSPWGWKTPCYRKVSYPIGGIVMLSQAPYNKIDRLSGIEAYVTIATRIDGRRWDRRVSDDLHQTENKLASSIPIWYLECLPDEAAAKLCHETVTQSPQERGQ